MFCAEKQELEFFATHENFRNSSCNSLVAQRKSLVQQEGFGDSLTTCENSHDSLRDSPNRETPRNNFLKSFLWETYFKPLPSFLKPLFQYFYIKTQSFWMVFHSINISKVILNSFHCFGSLDYVLVSFVLLVGIFIIGVGETLFLSNFLMRLVSFVDMHWMLAPCGKKNMY